MKKTKTEKGSTLYLKITYIFFFVIVYIVSVFYLFPYQKVKSYIEVKVGEAASCDVKIANMEFGIFSGLKLDGITFERNIKGKDTNILDIDELFITTSYYSLLFSDSVNLKIKSKIYGGELQGTTNINKPSTVSGLSFTLKDIDISKNPVLTSYYNVKTHGLLKGNISISEMQEGITRSSGTVNISITDGGANDIILNNIGSGIFKINDMKLPPISYSEIKISLEKEPKILKVKTFKIEGDDINGSVTGNLNLNNNIKMSSINLDVKLSISQDYMKKDSTNTLTLLEDRFLKSMKDSEGYFNIKIEGTIANPNPKIRNL